MVRLARGAMMPNRGRGRGRPGPPMLNPRDHMMGLRSHDIRPGFGPPLPGLGPPLPPRGPMGLPRRMPPVPLPPPPPMPPRPPLHMRPGFPPPPRVPLGRRPFPPGPPGLLPPPMRPLPPPPPPPLVMARGGLMRRPGLRPGMGLKRLGTAANGRIKRTQKRKPKLKEKSEGDFYCDTCDRGWQTQEELIKHQSEHETCGRDGCTFQAHPKIVQKHIQLQHLTGLYKRITFSYDPEEIQKWIAERKRRFPTAENIEKNRQQKEEMVKRGERIERERGFGRNGRGMRHMGGQNRHKRMRSHTYRHRNVHRRMTQERREKKPIGSSVKDYDPDSWRGKLPMFPGTGAFPEIKVEVTSEGVDSYFSDDEWEKDATCETEFKEPALVSGALCALMGNYGSDVSDLEDNRESESAHQLPMTNKILPSKNSNISIETVVNHVDTDARKPEVAVTQIKIEPVEPSQVITDLTVHETNVDDIGPEEVKIQREPPVIGTVPDKQPDVDKRNTGSSNRASHSKESVKNKFKKPVPTVRQPINHPMYRRKRLTLLEKLLSSEIRHERNVILQCVRYVVENNFFGVAPPEKEEDTQDNTIKSEATSPPKKKEDTLDNTITSEAT